MPKIDGRKVRGLMNKTLLVNDLIMGPTNKTPKQVLHEAIELSKKNKELGISFIDGIEIVEGTLEERIRRLFPGEPNERLLKALLNEIQEERIRIFYIGDVMFCERTKKGAILYIKNILNKKR